MSNASKGNPAGAGIGSWWTFAAGLVLWALILFVFGRMVATKDHVTEQLPLDAQLIELPEARPPAPASTTQPKEPTAKPKSQAVNAPPVNQAVDRTPSQPAAREEAAPVQAPAAASASPQTASTQSPSDASSGAGQMGARALYQPLPKIPDELRDQAIKTAAMARFHINADGTVSVELIKATSDPRINQIILNTLKTWKFFPATQDGKPVQSTQDIRVKIDIN
jgi:protein TonB